MEKFDFLNLNSNDEISKMKYDDIILFLNLLQDFKLSLRDNLGLDKNITFGLEIEFENISVLYTTLCEKFNNISLLPSMFYSIENLQKLKEYKKKNKLDSDAVFSVYGKYKDILPSEVFYWSVEKDLSLNNGAEITSPILIDDITYWKDLKKVCDFIKQYGEISEHSAGHIHFGTQILGQEKETWANFIKLWSVYENIIYRLGFNEYLSKNPGIRYCNPASDILSKYYRSLVEDYDLEQILNFLKTDRHYAVNFQNVLLTDKPIPFGTLEIRNPNGTLDPVIWQNNVNFFAKLLMYAKSNKFDMDTILKREKKLYDFQNYNYVFTEQAIELADMIFDNNLDKLYFLRQYIKDGETSLLPMKKCKKFTI